MEWQFDNDRPIYAQLVELIEQAVATGQYPAGSKLPGVRELAAEAGVNPNTMQRALAELEARGLLFTQRTSGRFVTEDDSLIKSSRQQMAQSLAGKYASSMQALGFTEEEITYYVRDALGRQDNA